MNSPENNSYLNTNDTLLNATIYDPYTNNTTAWFYGDDSLLTIFYDISGNTTLTYNWTSIGEGLHNWSVITSDGTINFTSDYMFFTVDLTSPLINFTPLTEENNTFFSRDWIFVNVSVTDTNYNYTVFYLYNNTGLVTSSNTTNTFVNWTGLHSNSEYWYNVTTYDKADNTNSTETRKITLDTVSPLINFTPLTEENNTFFSRDWIFVNVSVTDTNYNYTVFYLYNNTGLVTSSNTTNTFVNWTGLHSNSEYWYNVTTYDKADNTNSTETRKITLDTQNPQLNVLYPVNNTSYRLFFNETTLDLNYTTTDIHQDSCWFTNLTLQNQTLPLCQNGTINIPDQVNDNYYNITVYANDSATNINSSQVFFTTDYSQGHINNTVVDMVGVEKQGKWFDINTSTMCIGDWCEYLVTEVTLIYDSDNCTLSKDYSDSYLKEYEEGYYYTENETITQDWVAMCEIPGLYIFAVNYTVEDGSYGYAEATIVITELYVKILYEETALGDQYIRGDEAIIALALQDASGFPVTGHDVYIDIYYPNLTKWIDNRVLTEEVNDTGIYLTKETIPLDAPYGDYIVYYHGTYVSTSRIFKVISIVLEEQINQTTTEIKEIVTEINETVKEMNTTLLSEANFGNHSLSEVISDIEASKTYLETLLKMQYDFSQEEVFLITDSIISMTQIVDLVSSGEMSYNESEAEFNKIKKSLEPIFTKITKKEILDQIKIMQELIEELSAYDLSAGEKAIIEDSKKQLNKVLKLLEIDEITIFEAQEELNEIGGALTSITGGVILAESYTEEIRESDLPLITYLFLIICAVTFTAILIRRKSTRVEQKIRARKIEELKTVKKRNKKSREKKKRLPGGKKERNK